MEEVGVLGGRGIDPLQLEGSICCEERSGLVLRDGLQINNIIRSLSLSPFDNYGLGVQSYLGTILGRFRSHT